MAQGTNFKLTVNNKSTPIKDITMKEYIIFLNSPFEYKIITSVTNNYTKSDWFDCGSKYGGYIRINQDCDVLSYNTYSLRHTFDEFVNVPVITISQLLTLKKYGHLNVKRLGDLKCGDIAKIISGHYKDQYVQKIDYTKYNNGSQCHIDNYLLLGKRFGQSLVGKCKTVNNYLCIPCKLVDNKIEEINE